MTSLKALNDVRLNTTLFPVKSPIYNHVRNALVFSMIQRGDPKPLNIGYPQKNPIGISLWKEYPHRNIGVPSPANVEISDAQSSQTPVSFSNPVDQWVHQDLHGYEDAFKPSATGERQENLRMITFEPREMTAEPPPPTRRVRAVRGAPRNPDSEIPATSTVTGSALQSTKHSKAGFQPNHENRQTSQFPGGPKIEPPYMPSSANPVTSTTSPEFTTKKSSELGRASWERRVVPRVTGGLLVDVLGKDKVGSATPKIFKHTMNQKKPQQPLTGSRTETLKRFEKAASQILRLALVRQGPITFEVKIGRLLINPQICDPEFKRPFALSEWPSVGRESILTPRITTRSLDIEAVLDMRQSQGRRLFQVEPRERRVTYAITCKTRHNDLVMIEVCDDGNFGVKGSKILVGALEWHYPLRLWDSRLQLMIQEHRFLEYDTQIKEIVNRMSVQTTSDEKVLNFSTRTIDQELRIQSVLLRRKTSHSVITYPDLLLHLEEVQDLDVQQIPGPGNWYQGAISLPAKMVSTGKLWWEASITSLNAANILKENDTLELGETVKWKPESIIGAGIIRDLYSLSNELVTKIDHVGIFNRGYKASSDSKTGTRSQTNPSTDVEGTVGASSIW